MSPQELVHNLECPSAVPVQHYRSIALPIEIAAKLGALSELYPAQTQEKLMTLLIQYALNKIELSPGQ